MRSIFKRGGAPEILTRAASMPSAEVPDIMPRTNMGLVAMRRAKEIFTTELTGHTEGSEKGRRRSNGGYAKPNEIAPESSGSPRLQSRRAGRECRKERCPCHVP